VYYLCLVKNYPPTNRPNRSVGIGFIGYLAIYYLPFGQSRSLHQNKGREKTYVEAKVIRWKTLQSLYNPYNTGVFENRFPYEIHAFFARTHQPSEALFTNNIVFYITLLNKYL
jgi:hypothetical protein